MQRAEKFRIKSHGGEFSSAWLAVVTNDNPRVFENDIFHMQVVRRDFRRDGFGTKEDRGHRRTLWDPKVSLQVSADDKIILYIYILSCKGQIAEGHSCSFDFD